MYQGYWQTTVGVELKGKILVLIGLGKVGSQVAKIGKVFGMQVMAWSENLSLDKCKERDGLPSSKEALIQNADFISIHVPKNKETINLVSKEKLSIAKEGSIIINTSRGGLIDEQEVFNLVNENKLYSAGFDVYEKEPPEMSEEKNRSKVITLPHLGASTKEAQARAGQQLVENIKNILNEDLSSVVNKNLK